MVASLTPDRLQELRRIAAELRRIAAETTPGTYRIIETGLALTIETALALLDRIEALEAENERLRQIEAAARTLVDTAFEVPGPDEYVYQEGRDRLTWEQWRALEALEEALYGGEE